MGVADCGHTCEVSSGYGGQEPSVIFQLKWP